MSSENDQSGTDRDYMSEDVPEVSSLSEALDEIIAGRDARVKGAAKRKRDDSPKVSEPELTGLADYTLAIAKDEASYRKIMEEMLDRNLQTYGGQFHLMTIIFERDRSNLASRQQHLLPANVVRRIENETKKQKSTSTLFVLGDSNPIQIAGASASTLRGAATATAAYKRKKTLEEIDDDMDRYWAGEVGQGQGNSTLK
ncbi:hypothetical protein K449DRAFT_380914 [Hypoxylon sp. EC38]|nr:hypothetical protein K449DRAFT_380914 [Hypoxylon sp. EC38]